MKKNKSLQLHTPRDKRSPRRPTPTEAVQFLEDFRAMIEGQDETTQAISLRVPANVLRSFKALSKSRGLRYQAQIVMLMRDWLRKS